MRRLRRIVLWGIVAAPVAILVIGYAVARVWLNDHLRREIAAGAYRMKLVNPVLRWDLDFAADSVAVESPSLKASAGAFAAEVRIWNSVVSLKPDIRISADTVRLEFRGGTESAAAPRRRKRGRPDFPDIRLPFAFRADARRLEASSPEGWTVAFDGPALFSQGPKGAAVEWRSVSWMRREVPEGPSRHAFFKGRGKLSARWFGKTLRYALRTDDGAGAYLRLDGTRLKSDLREGRDSVEAAFPDLGLFRPVLRRDLPAFREFAFEAVLQTGKSVSARARLRCESPSVWKIPGLKMNAALDFADSVGRLTIHSRGPAGEAAYLQGRISIPGDSGGGLENLIRNAPGAGGEFAGYTRRFRFRIGDFTMPGDAEIRKLRILPGPVFEAEIRTRDNTLARGRAFRGPDSGWAATFEGTPSARETWALGWTRGHVAYASGRVSGSADRNGLRIEAWVAEPRAYGAAADSLYALQRVDKHGYYLLASEVYGRDGIWPITGRVEWKKPGAPRRGPRRVSLAFATRHARYGSAEFSMPRKKLLRLRTGALRAHKLPFAGLPRLKSLAPEVSGSFEWDVRARTGAIDAEASFTYAGQNLHLDAAGDWDPSLLSVRNFDLAASGATLHAAGALRLGGRQFWQLRGLGFGDLRALSLDARRFDLARLAPYAGPDWPIARGMLDGALAYSDTGGFRGGYTATDLELAPLRGKLTLPELSLEGRGGDLALSLRSASESSTWLNDSLRLEVSDAMGLSPGISVSAASETGLRVRFSGKAADRRMLDGRLEVEGEASLPGEAGDIRDIGLAGSLRVPLSAKALESLALEAAGFSGRYAVPGLDTQTVAGTLSVRGGVARIADLRARRGDRVTLEGEAEARLVGGPIVTARLRGDGIAVRWPGMRKVLLRKAEASLRLDSAGVSARAGADAVEFAASRPPVAVEGILESPVLEFRRQRAAPGSKDAGAPPEIRVKARLRDFLFRHKIGFREIQKSIGKVKADKRKKRSRPVDLQLNLETAGAGNRIETDVLRMAFAGDMAVRGIYPYLLVSGGIAALKGELGQTSQSYDLSEFDLKWQNATLEEGRLSVEAGKKLRVNCRPETERTCNVFVRVAGRLDEMDFTYDTDCGANTGGNLEPTALINSVSRGCWSETDVAGSGNGNYREAVAALLEPALNERLTRVGERFTGGWIKRTRLTGIGAAVAQDTAAGEPLAIGVETKEKWGVSLKASAGYHPEKREENTWESKVAVEWRPPLEKVAGNSEWKRRVRDRVTVEASAETRPEEKIKSENKEARMQVGLRYRYKFWKLW